MSDSFHSHGLAGIDLHHATARRNEERFADSTARAINRSEVGPIRQVIGSLMIALGDRLAGQPTSQPRTARFV
jgi:uncharacterized membrane protein YedE/YeeE